MIQKILPFTTKNSSIKIFRHALALDENRYKFDYEPYLSAHEQQMRSREFDQKKDSELEAFGIE
jgi:hypothetical protein